MNINGKIHDYPGPVNEGAAVNVLDRGFIYGDSLYEVLRTYNGALFRTQDHLSRLLKSAERAKMTIAQSGTYIESEVQRTVEEFKRKFNEHDAYCRIIITRGIGSIGFALSNIQSPTQIVIIVKPLDLKNKAAWDRGMKLKIASRLRNDRRALDPAMKSGNYLNSLLAFLEASDEGFEDAVLCNLEGFLTEGTTFNLFYVRRNKIATPPLDAGILEGVTRRHVIDIARKHKLPVFEVNFPPERLYDADEIFITSTLREVFPVTQIDDIEINGGKPGPTTKKLKDLFHRWAEKQI